MIRLKRKKLSLERNNDTESLNLQIDRIDSLGFLHTKPQKSESMFLRLSSVHMMCSLASKKTPDGHVETITKIDFHKLGLRIARQTCQMQNA